MVLPHGDDIVLVDQRFAVEGGFVDGWEDRQGDVAGAAGQRFQSLGRAVPGLDDKVDARRGLGERTMQGTGDQDAGKIGGEDAHGLADVAERFLRRIDHGGDTDEEGFQRVAQAFGLRRQAHAALAALQQRIAEEVAAAVQRAGCGGLGQVQPGGGARDVGLVEQGVEDDEKVQVYRS